MSCCGMPPSVKMKMQLTSFFFAPGLSWAACKRRNCARLRPATLPRRRKPRRDIPSQKDGNMAPSSMHEQEIVGIHQRPQEVLGRLLGRPLGEQLSRRTLLLLARRPAQRRQAQLLDDLL